MGESPLLRNPSDGCGWSAKVHEFLKFLEEWELLTRKHLTVLAPIHLKSYQLSTPFQGCHKKCPLQGVVDHHRRRRRVRSEGSDPGPPICHDLTLIDSSDDDTPFVVTRSAAAPRPSRRLVLVAESVNATPQSIQDRDWGRGAPESSLIDRTLGSDRCLSVVPGSNSGVEVDEESVRSATSDAMSLFGGSEASGEEVPGPVPEVAVEVPVFRATGLQLRAAWQAMDAVDMLLMFQHRPEVMRSVPHFLQGPFRNAMLMALEEACHPEGLRKERGWKLFMLLPRLLLHKPPRGGNVPRHKLITRFEHFAQGQWGSLIRDSMDACEIASRNRSRRTRRPVDNVAKRAERAQTLVMMGEVSAGRQALEGAALAPGNMTTLNELRNPDRRPVQPIRELPREFREFQPEVPFKLDEHRFAQNVRSARRGAALGPSGMTIEHLRILLSNPSHFQWLFRAAAELARGDIPAAVVDVVRLGRMTALQKPDRGCPRHCGRRCVASIGGAPSHSSSCQRLRGTQHRFSMR